MSDPNPNPQPKKAADMTPAEYAAAKQSLIRQARAANAINSDYRLQKRIEAKYKITTKP